MNKNIELIRWCRMLCASTTYHCKNKDEICCINGMEIHRGYDCVGCPYNASHIQYDEENL